MIPILAGENLELEVDQNPNGMPVIVVHVRYGGKIIRSFMLGIMATELLITELKEKLEEIK